MPGQNCTIPPGEYQCEVSGPLDLTGLTDQSLVIGLSCNAFCENGTTAHNVRADLDHAVVTLSDPTPPAPPTATGPLTQPSWHSGYVALDVSSTDAVGIRQVQARAPDATVVASADQVCDYTYPVPCPQAAAVPLQINTAQLDDGVDQLTLIATDTAQNTTASTLTVMIANHPPATPTLSGAPPGPTAQRSATIAAQIAAGGVPVVKLAWMLCGSTCGPANTLPASGGTSSTFIVTAPSEGTYTIRAYTVDAAGHASATVSAAYDVVSTRPPVTLPVGPNASVRLPEAVGSGGVHLLLSIRRLSHQRLELQVRTRPKRVGRLLLRLAFAGHHAQAHRLFLRSGVAGVVAPIPRGASELTLTLAGLGANAVRHVHLVAPARHRS